jgi:glutaminyl-peptide cyclotransferase
VRALFGALALLAAAAAAPSAEPPRAAPPFDGAAALRHLARLVAIGPRPAGSPALTKARAYILGELRAAGISARLEPFEADTPHWRLKMANLVAVLPGRQSDVIMLAGHYDTKWFREIRFVGANDGGSSAALLIELAGRLASRPREFTYWVVWFDGEEARETWSPTDSLYGSRWLARELARKGQLPRAVIVADMIGDRDLDIRREAVSTEWLTKIIWATAARRGAGANFLAEAQVVEDDHAPFLSAGVPSALVIDFDYPPWHTAGDTLDKVSAESLAIVGNVLLDALPAIEERLGRAVK